MNHNWEFDYSNAYNHNTGMPQSGAPQPSVPNQQSGSAVSSEPQAQPTVAAEQPGYGGSVPPVPAGGVPQQAPRRKERWGMRIGAVAALLALCAGVGYGGGYLGGMAARSANTPVVYSKPSDQEQTPLVENDRQMATIAGPLSISDVAEKVSPSVVEVTTEKMSSNPFFPQYVRDGAGSGVIISEDGYIVTNNHVVAGSRQITVRTSDKKEYPAELIGTDPKTDMAVLKIEAAGLIKAAIGDSEKLKVGEFVLAVGNPLGTLGGTVTNGIISALDRDIVVQGQTMTLLQTNAAVSPGNSGGGLFNERGELIGIVNAKSAGEGTEGLGFAIPVNTAMQVAQNLIENGYVSGRPEMGIRVLAISDLQGLMQYGVEQPGVYIMEVVKGSGAEKAGLKAGDLIISVDGNAVRGTQDVTAALDKHNVGDELKMQVARNGKIVEANIVLQEQLRVNAKEQPNENSASKMPKVEQR